MEPIRRVEVLGTTRDANLLLLSSFASFGTDACIDPTVGCTLRTPLGQIY